MSNPWRKSVKEICQYFFSMPITFNIIFPIYLENYTGDFLDSTSKGVTFTLNLKRNHPFSKHTGDLYIFL